MTKAATAGDNIIPKTQVFVDRIENVEGEIAELSEDRKSIYAEAKAAGLNVKALKRVIAIRKKDQDAWRVEEDAVDAFLLQLGML